MKVVVKIMLKNGVLDPQGKAIEHALGGLGFNGVGEVRQGKVITLDFPEATDEAMVRKEVAKMCGSILANPVIEDYEIDIAS